MKFNNYLFAFLIFAFAGSIVGTYSGCLVVVGNQVGSESVSFDNYVDLFTQAFYDKDEKTAIKLKKGFPTLYKRMIKNLDKNSKNQELSKEDRESASDFSRWAKSLK